MPVSKKWSPATRAHIKANAPTSSGVYELKSFGELVYIGRARNLQSRLLEHLNQRNPNYYRFETAGFFSSAASMETEHLDSYGYTKSAMPKWNQRDPR